MLLMVLFSIFFIQTSVQSTAIKKLKDNENKTINNLKQLLASNGLDNCWSKLIADNQTEKLNVLRATDEFDKQQLNKKHIILEELETLNQMKSCVLEQVSPDDKQNENFRRDAVNPSFWFSRPDVDLNDTKDCLRNSRKHVRFAPFKCYSKNFGDWSIDSDFYPFMNEVINDIRFAFDFILYDKSMGTEVQYHFWYLMFYLKTLVEEIPDANDLIDMVNGENRLYTSFANMDEIEGQSSILAEHIVTIISQIAKLDSILSKSDDKKKKIMSENADKEQEAQHGEQEIGKKIVI